jgi:aryl-alcohol dehydrogenase-like predicted oxidoreductase
MSKPSSSVRPTAPGLDADSLRANESGTSTYRARFEERFSSDFYRRTTFGPTVSSIGIGTYLGESTDEDDRAYESAVAHAIASGINLIDTAINYRSQRSECAIGAAIQRCLASGDISRTDLVICSKGGYIPFDRTPPASKAEYHAYLRREFLDQQILRQDELVGGGHSVAPRFLRYCVAKSRQNLGLRTIDVYHVHNPGQVLAVASREDFQARMKAAFAVLEEAAGRNDIGVYGCATWDELRVTPDARGHVSLEELVGLARELAGEGHHFRVIQLPINLALLEAVRVPTQMVEGKLVTVLEAAEHFGLTVIGSASLMQARLTRGLPPALGEHFPDAKTDAQRAISFARSLPGLTAALVGMKSTEHVDENMGSARKVTGAV